MAELTQQRNHLLHQFSKVASAADATSPTLAISEPQAHEQLTPEQVESNLATAKAVIKEHISLLHQYNEIRDVGLGLMGIIADQRGVRLRDVQEDFGVDTKD